MRKCILLVFLVVLFFSCSESPSEPVVESAGDPTTFGEAYNDFGNAVAQTADGGFVIIGSQYSTATQEDIYLIKTKSDGTLDTSFVLNTVDANLDDITLNNSNRAASINPTDDGGYIIVGSNFNGIDYDVWLTKIDENNAIEWDKKFDQGNGDDFGYSVEICRDNGYIISGATYDGSDYNMLLIKTDNQGDLDQSFNNGSVLSISSATAIADDKAYFSQQTDDGGYIVVGETRSNGSGGSDIWLSKINSLGVESWATPVTFGGALDEKGIFVQETQDNGYIVVGNSRSDGSGQSDIFMVKTDSDGDKEWSRYIGGVKNDFANCVRQTNDGGYIIAGSTYTTNSDVWVIKIQSGSRGLIDWSKTFGGDYDDIASSVVQTSDGGYIITGSMVTPEKQSDILLIKLDADGNQEF